MLVEIPGRSDDESVQVVGDIRPRCGERVASRSRVFRAHHDVGRHEAAVPNCLEGLQLPARQLFDHFGGDRSRQRRDHAAGPDLTRSAVVDNLDRISAIRLPHRGDPRAQRHTAADRPSQPLGELVGSTVEDAITAVVAGHGPVGPRRAALIAPEPQGAVKGDLDRRARVHDLAPPVEETVRVRREIA